MALFKSKTAKTGAALFNALKYGVYAAGLGLAAIWLSQGSFPSTTLSLSGQHVSEIIEGPKNTHRTADLSAFAEVERKIFLMEKRLNTLEHQYQDITGQVEALEFAKADQAQSESFAESATRLSAEEIREARDRSRENLDNAIHREAFDPAWQQSAESLIDELSMAAEGVVVMSLNCGATLCRTDVIYRSENGRDAFEARLMRSELSRGGTKIMSDGSEEGPIYATIYTARQGALLPE